jgi:cytochrome c5
MNRHRIVFSTLLVTLLVTSALLMGCGGSTTTPAPAPTETAAPEPTDTPAPEPTATDTQAPPAEEPTATSTEEPEEEPTEEPAVAIDGETLLEERCTQCHDLERTTQQQKDRAGWTQTVERMVNQGAQLNAEEQAILIDYLVETYGP